jgi:hypothetical protein
VNHNFLPEAEAEYLDAIRFYEDRQIGLGAVFIAEFESSLRLALDRPQAWRLVHDSGIRRIGLSHFPYAYFIGSSLNHCKLPLLPITAKSPVIGYLG